MLQAHVGSSSFQGCTKRRVYKQQQQHSNVFKRLAGALILVEDHQPKKQTPTYVSAHIGNGQANMETAGSKHTNIRQPITRHEHCKKGNQPEDQAGERTRKEEARNARKQMQDKIMTSPANEEMRQHRPEFSPTETILADTHNGQTSAQNKKHAAGKS